MARSKRNAKSGKSKTPSDDRAGSLSKIPPEELEELRRRAGEPSPPGQRLTKIGMLCKDAARRWNLSHDEQAKLKRLLDADGEIEATPEDPAEAIGLILPTSLEDPRSAVAEALPELILPTTFQKEEVLPALDLPRYGKATPENPAVISKRVFDAVSKEPSFGIGLKDLNSIRAQLHAAQVEGGFKKLDQLSVAEVRAETAQTVLTALPDAAFTKLSDEIVNAIANGDFAMTPKRIQVSIPPGIRNKLGVALLPCETEAERPFPEAEGWLQLRAQVVSNPNAFLHSASDIGEIRLPPRFGHLPPPPPKGCPVCQGTQSADEPIVTCILRVLQSTGKFEVEGLDSFWRTFDFYLCADCEKKLNSIPAMRSQAKGLLEDAIELDPSNQTIKDNLKYVKQML